MILTVQFYLYIFKILNNLNIFYNFITYNPEIKDFFLRSNPKPTSNETKEYPFIKLLYCLS